MKVWSLLSIKRVHLNKSSNHNKRSPVLNSSLSVISTIKVCVSSLTFSAPSPREWCVTWRLLPAPGGQRSCRAAQTCFPSLSSQKHVTMWSESPQPDGRIERTCDRSSKNSSAPCEIKTGQQLYRPPSAPSDTMDCGIFTSKTILLFLSLVFWVSGGAFLHLQRFQLILVAALQDGVNSIVAAC